VQTSPQLTRYSGQPIRDGGGGLHIAPRGHEIGGSSMTQSVRPAYRETSTVEPAIVPSMNGHGIALGGGGVQGRGLPGVARHAPVSIATHVPSASRCNVHWPAVVGSCGVASGGAASGGAAETGSIGAVFVVAASTGGGVGCIGGLS
jgi:hypothetical protein